MELADISSSDSDLSSQHVILTLVGGKCTPESCCAAEEQTDWGLHAPVECTELDLQHLSNTSEFQAFRPSGIIPTNMPRLGLQQGGEREGAWKRRLLKRQEITSYVVTVQNHTESLQKRMYHMWNSSGKFKNVQPL